MKLLYDITLRNDRGGRAGFKLELSAEGATEPPGTELIKGAAEDCARELGIGDGPWEFLAAKRRL